MGARGYGNDSVLVYMADIEACWEAELLPSVGYKMVDVQMPPLALGKDNQKTADTNDVEVKPMQENGPVFDFLVSASGPEVVDLCEATPILVGQHAVVVVVDAIWHGIVTGWNIGRGPSHEVSSEILSAVSKIELCVLGLGLLMEQAWEAALDEKWLGPQTLPGFRDEAASKGIYQGNLEKDELKDLLGKVVESGKGGWLHPAQLLLEVEPFPWRETRHECVNEVLASKGVIQGHVGAGVWG
jgi:hypothetical protein